MSSQPPLWHHLCAKKVYHLTYLMIVDPSERQATNSLGNTLVATPATLPSPKPSLQYKSEPSTEASNTTQSANLPPSTHPRVVIVGAGFAGLEAAKTLESGPFQVVILDKNNYNQFQPLFYQVATAGLEPSSISFPLRKLFQNKPNVHIRVTAVQSIEPERKVLNTTIGEIRYDYLILALGGDTNFFGNERIKQFAIPMKSVSEALYLRNRLLQNYEDASVTTDEEERQALMNVVVVGGGPTGVEVSGALEEMRQHVLPKDIPELNFKKMEVTLLEASPNLLGPMRASSREAARHYLESMGVKVRTNTAVTDYDGKWVTLADGSKLLSRTLIWAAGIKANGIQGIPDTCYTRGNRLVVDEYNTIIGLKDVFAVGDMSYMTTTDFPQGHPQVAQVAMQMSVNLGKNLLRTINNQPIKPFRYLDLGSMATIGRNKAVADFPKFSVTGLFAWFIWMFIHLISLVGARSKVVVFINWMVSYFSYDQSLRLIIRPTSKPIQPEEKVS